MNLFTKAAAVLACSAGLLGIGSGLANATASTVRTEGFTITNMTGDRLTLTAVDGFGQLAKGPKLGSTLLPGDHATFEVKRLGAVDEVDVHYSGPELIDFAVATLRVELGAVKSDCVGMPYLCSTSVLHPRDVLLEDQEDTVHELYGAQARTQADAVRDLCRASVAGACDFDPERQELIYGHRQVLDTYENAGEAPAPFHVERKSIAKSENSLDVSIEVGTELEAFGQKLDMKIKTAYGHKWMQADEVGVNASMEVPPGRVGAIWTEVPLSEVTGTLTASLGNTTYILHDVKFDAPDHDRKVNWGTYDTPIPAHTIDDSAKH